MSRKDGESMVFTGGSENSPRVVVDRFNCPGSLHHGDTILRIQDTHLDEMVSVSPETLQAILKWYYND